MIGFTTDNEQDVSIKTHTSKTVLDSFLEYNFTISKSLFKTKELLLRKIRTISVSICTAAAILSIVAFYCDRALASKCIYRIQLFCGVYSFMCCFICSNNTQILKIKKIYSEVYYIQSPEWCKEHNYNYVWYKKYDDIYESQSRLDSYRTFRISPSTRRGRNGNNIVYVCISRYTDGSSPICSFNQRLTLQSSR